MDVALCQWEKRNQWHFAFSIRKLLDADVREPSLASVGGGLALIPNDLPLPGRWYLLQAHYQR